MLLANNIKNIILFRMKFSIGLIKYLDIARERFRNVHVSWSSFKIQSSMIHLYTCTWQSHQFFFFFSLSLYSHLFLGFIFIGPK